jgi:uncharacterized membrane protein YbaN (DUF454 family)
MLIEILSGILILVGLFCIVKPDNFLLPFTKFYYNSKKPLKPVIVQGRYGAKHIKEFGKTKGILLYMRIFGIVMLLVGVLFLLSALNVI